MAKYLNNSTQVVRRKRDYLAFSTTVFANAIQIIASALSIIIPAEILLNGSPMKTEVLLFAFVVTGFYWFIPKIFEVFPKNVFSKNPAFTLALLFGVCLIPLLLTFLLLLFRI